MICKKTWKTIDETLNRGNNKTNFLVNLSWTIN